MDTIDEYTGQRVFHVFCDWAHTRGAELKRIRLRNAYLAGANRRKTVPKKSRGKSVRYVTDADYEYEG